MGKEKIIANIDELIARRARENPLSEGQVRQACIGAFLDYDITGGMDFEALTAALNVLIRPLLDAAAHLTCDHCGQDVSGDEFKPHRTTYCHKPSCVSKERDAAARDMQERVLRYPHPCGLCDGQVESDADKDWHGLGNCVPICARCVGSGIEPDADKIRESYDQHAVGIIKNLAMLVRRLCYKHPKENLVTQALNYLRGEGLQGSVLRSKAAIRALAPAKEKP